MKAVADSRLRNRPPEGADRSNDAAEVMHRPSGLRRASASSGYLDSPYAANRRAAGPVFLLSGEGLPAVNGDRAVAALIFDGRQPQEDSMLAGFRLLVRVGDFVWWSDPAAGPHSAWTKPRRGRAHENGNPFEYGAPTARSETSPIVVLGVVKLTSVRKALPASPTTTGSPCETRMRCGSLLAPSS